MRLRRLRHKLSDLEVYASTTRAGTMEPAFLFGSEFGVTLFGFIILEIAIAVGWIAATGRHINDSWKTVLIALAAAALGFGAAHLVARRSSNSRGRELERDYERLKQHSKGLLATVDKFENRSRTS